MCRSTVLALQVYAAQVEIVERREKHTLGRSAPRWIQGRQELSADRSGGDYLAHLRGMREHIPPILLDPAKQIAIVVHLSKVDPQLHEHVEAIVDGKRSSLQIQAQRCNKLEPRCLLARRRGAPPLPGAPARQSPVDERAVTIHNTPRADWKGIGAQQRQRRPFVENSLVRAHQGAARGLGECNLAHEVGAVAHPLSER
ncbi:hypothetical protein FA95DRAFT_95029 [Auriscalpium vulgare]|uniref:Uncharacterized protein n=1 Tax=Auriscalpium vulgare TaxID=40419 RepID=A0ACB8RQA8_9AGAM|nr:hypothetical protein FA95DRAFT_95029 [Auriscalpium vulgare]